MKNRLIILATIGIAACVAIATPLFKASALSIAASLLLLTACLLPALLWVWNGMKTLPLFEVFALAHIGYYWYPSVRAESIAWRLSEPLRIKLNLLVITFLVAGGVVYYGRLARLKKSARRPFSLWERTIDMGTANIVFSTGMTVWIAFQFAVIMGWIPDLGSFFGILRAAATVAGSVSIFYFTSRIGERSLSRAISAIFFGAFTFGVLLNFASGFLINGTFLICSAMFGYAVGSKRIPILTALVAAGLVLFLHIGKGGMRERFWEQDIQGTTAGVNLIELYSYWFQESWRNIGAPWSDEEESAIASRADMLRMLALVVLESPGELPYLNGQTYWEGLQLLVPSFFWKGRPEVHGPMQKMGIYYGVHTEETVQLTSISFGQISEGWANFGWLGVIGAGAFFGLFYSFGMQVAYLRPSNSIGFLFGLLFSGFAVNLEHFAGAIMMAFTQSAVLAFVGLYVLSRPKHGQPSAQAAVAEASPALDN